MNKPISRREAISALGVLALPLTPFRRSEGPDDLSGQSSAGQAQPDLGNLSTAVEWINEVQAPALSFLDSRWKLLSEWKAVARPTLHRHLSFNSDRPSIQSEIVGREDREGFQIEHVRIHASPAYQIPAAVLVPTRRRSRLPAVVALHCHGGQYQWGYRKLVSSPDDPPVLQEYRRGLYGRPYVEVLARRGLVVIVIDAFYFGTRRLHVETLKPEVIPADGREPFRALATQGLTDQERTRALNRVAGAFEAVMAKSLFAAGATWPGLLTWDDRRSIDYLLTRADVDPERIGCIGFSGGALRAAQLVGADPRLKAACVTAWMTEWDDMLPSHARRHTWMAFVPGLKASLDLPDVASLIAPGDLLVQQCTRDTLFPISGMRAAVEKLTRIYAKAGVAERFCGSFHDEPHSFRPQMQEEAFAWLERWL
jgi:dienelactone hydrolase